MRKKAPKSPEIVELIKSGKKTGNSCLSVFLIRRKDKEEAKLFIATISKKIVRKSTDRNLIKRRIKTIFKGNSPAFKGCNVLVMARSGISGLKTFKELEENMASLLDKFRKKEK